MRKIKKIQKGAEIVGLSFGVLTGGIFVGVLGEVLAFDIVVNNLQSQHIQEYYDFNDNYKQQQYKILEAQLENKEISPSEFAESYTKVSDYSVDYYFANDASEEVKRKYNDLEKARTIVSQTLGIAGVATGIGSIASLSTHLIDMLTHGKEETKAKPSSTYNPLFGDGKASDIDDDSYVDEVLKTVEALKSKGETIEYNPTLNC